MRIVFTFPLHKIDAGHSVNTFPFESKNCNAIHCSFPFDVCHRNKTQNREAFQCNFTCQKSILHFSRRTQNTSQKLNTSSQEDFSSLSIVLSIVPNLNADQVVTFLMHTTTCHCDCNFRWNFFFLFFLLSSQINLFLLANRWLH